MQQIITFFKNILKQDFLFYIIKENSDNLTNHLVKSNIKQDTLIIVLVYNKLPLLLNYSFEIVKIESNENEIYFIKKLGKLPYKNIAWLDEITSQLNFSTNRDFIYNTILPTDFNPIKYETLDHTYFFECFYGINDCKDKNYIEYGVRTCSNLNKVSKFFKTCHGVDIINYNCTSNNIKKYIMDTSVFAKDILPTLNFDFCFIDASHNFKDVYNDFVNIFKYINTNGIIFLHDTYPCDESFLDKNACYDCYKTPLKIKEVYKDKIQILTIPLNPGLTIIKKIT